MYTGDDGEESSCCGTGSTTSALHSVDFTDIICSEDVHRTFTGNSAPETEKSKVIYCCIEFYR